MSALALIPGLILAAVAGTASDGAIREAVREVYESEQYQVDTTPPPDAVAPPPEAPAVPAPRVTRRSKKSLPGTENALGPALRFLLWIILGVAGALLVAWIVREWAPFWPGGPRARVRKLALLRQAPAAATVSPVPVDERPEYERHAAEGRYEEAVHAILLALQWEIGRRRREPFPASLTSREILRRARLRAPVAETFGRVVTVVEGSLFGGVEVGAGHYEECTGHYRSVLAALAEARA